MALHLRSSGFYPSVLSRFFSCSLVRNKKEVKYTVNKNVTTDVRILSQFLRPDGSVIPRSVSGISLRSQKHIELMIERARKAGELINTLKMI
ncbi:unnamed protein product [Trichobilharzia regenti]|nr:unnamed protein product [Trichobilharzia regenti]